MEREYVAHRTGRVCQSSSTGAKPHFDSVFNRFTDGRLNGTAGENIRDHKAANKGVNSLNRRIDVDKFVQDRQGEIEYLVNTALNRAGDKVKQKVADGELNATIQDVLPLLLYEVLVTNTVATLRLVAEMLEQGKENNNHGMDH